MVKQRMQHVGMYVRLSKEDLRQGESLSIENQKAILLKHVVEQEWNLIDIYVDDGYSGGNFERPGFQRLIADVKNGLVNIILVKDMSRFGRDYIEVGRYTDVLFPSWNCRFIALLDDIDTAKDDNDMMHFRSLMNDYHLKDLSNKIKTVFSDKIQKHGLITGRPPYGYLRSPENKHQLIPNTFLS